MDNQHKKITGYRDLSQEEIDLMNKAKDLAEQCGEFCNKLTSIRQKAIDDAYSDNSPEAMDVIDARWLATGKTDLQKGFMSVIRSIARPTTF